MHIESGKELNQIEPQGQDAAMGTAIMANAFSDHEGYVLHQYVELTLELWTFFL